jgi:hypothetical protein
VTGMRPLVRSDELTAVLQILRPLIRLWPRRATRSGKPRMRPLRPLRCADRVCCLILLLLQARAAKKAGTRAPAPQSAAVGERSCLCSNTAVPMLEYCCACARILLCQCSNSAVPVLENCRECARILLLPCSNTAVPVLE